MPADPALSSLMRAYLTNIYAALVNRQDKHAELLVEHALALLPPDQPSSEHALRPSPIQLSCGVGLHAGKKRQQNEDSTFAISGVVPGTGEHFGLFVVADGMGGHARGQEAACQATHAIVDELLPRLQPGSTTDSAKCLLRDVIERVNALLVRKNDEEGVMLGRARMGTTLTVALVRETELLIANVGDSRAYLYRPGSGLRQVTVDHSVVQLKVAMGQITPEEIYTDRQRNEIYRCLGERQMVAVDIFQEQLGDGDVLLLCSDGLWEMTRDLRIAEIVQQSHLSPANMAEQLVELALQGGGSDNIGLVVAKASVIDIAALATMALPELAPLFS